MAQYQKNFYSSSLYGRINAFYGEYITEEFDLQEPFSSNINAIIEAQLPYSFYPATSNNFSFSADEDWATRGTEMYTTKAFSPIEVELAGDDLKIQVRMQNVGVQVIEATLFAEELVDGSYTWVEKEQQTKDTLSIINSEEVESIEFSSYGFGNYKVKIQARNNDVEAIIVGTQVRTTDFDLFIRTSTDKKNWSEWVATPLTKSVSFDVSYTCTGQAQVENKPIRYVQGKIAMLSSDNEVSPEIERIELRSDDSGLYDYDGEYSVWINMDLVASCIGKVFRQTNKIRWVEQHPNGTELNIRSSSSDNNIFWTPITAPYRQDTKRLRLTDGTLQHSVTLGPIDEGARFDFGKTKQFLTWNTQSLYPKDETYVKTSFIFSKTAKDIEDPLNKLLVIEHPHKESNRNLALDPQPYYLTVKMTREHFMGTPVVDFIDIDQMIRYEEVINVTDKDISAVDSLGKGIKPLQKIKDCQFSYPDKDEASFKQHLAFNQENIAAAPQEYYLEDKMKRPSDVMLYLLSEQDKGARSNISVLPEDEIMAKAIVRNESLGETTGVRMHYQYGAGKVQYLRPYDREMDSTFTPYLEESKRYRYYIENGWPNETHMTRQGETLEDVAASYEVTVEEVLSANTDIFYNEDGSLIGGQTLVIPNHTKNEKVRIQFENHTAYTEKSSHNALYQKAQGADIIDFSSENIHIAVSEVPEIGYVDWVSEEKIYSGVINVNDERQEFVRTQYNRLTNVDYTRKHTVVEGDTWESIAIAYDVHIDDLLHLNPNADKLVVGDTIIVPPNIILPELVAEAEFEGDNPYTISIIEDSVFKRTGEKIDESFIPIDWDSKHPPLVITFRDSDMLTANMVRGSGANGMDPLPLSGVKEIVSITNKDGSVKYHEWNDFLQTGDYRLTNNYVNWSPVGAGTLEPKQGEEYIVTYIRQEVDTVKVHLDTTYSERLGTDIVWRSPEVKVFEGVCTPSEDFRMELPAPSTFEGYNNNYKNVGYVIEDNDLWVDTSLERDGEKSYLVGSLKGKDPSQNWHPTIHTGYYYLGEKEFYLYSQPMKTILEGQALPTVENIHYVNGPTGIGALLQPSRENLVRDSIFDTTEWKVSKVLNVNSIPSLF